MIQYFFPRCNHPQDYKKTRSDDDMFRMRMVSKQTAILFVKSFLHLGFFREINCTRFFNKKKYILGFHAQVFIELWM